MADPSILQGLSVLLLEDDPFINMSTAAMLEEFGCSVRACFNLHGAVAAIANWTPDFALLDINIGGQKNFDFASTLSERWVPIAFLTGYDSSVLKGAGLNHPYCQKPCKIEHLAEVIATALNRSRDWGGA